VREGIAGLADVGRHRVVEQGVAVGIPLGVEGLQRHRRLPRVTGVHVREPGARVREVRVRDGMVRRRRQRRRAAEPEVGAAEVSGKQHPAGPVPHMNVATRVRSQANAVLINSRCSRPTVPCGWSSGAFGV
jgi:hypothetical protein